MSSLDQAINRLQQSVEKLESSLNASASKNAESDQIQARCDRLLEVTKQVDEGLDKTIDRLKFVLED